MLLNKDMEISTKLPHPFVKPGFRYCMHCMGFRYCMHCMGFRYCMHCMGFITILSLSGSMVKFDVKSVAKHVYRQTTRNCEKITNYRRTGFGLRCFLHKPFLWIARNYALQNLCAKYFRNRYLRFTVLIIYEYRKRKYANILDN